MTASVFVAGKLLPETMEALSKWDVKAFSGEENITEAELIKNVTEVDAIICPLSSPISAKVLESAKNLKIVANIGAGFDNIDVKKAQELGIAVTNTPDVSTEATAELTLGLILDVARRISEGDRLCRETPEQFKGWAPTFFLGTELSGKTLGIIGLGRIGQAVAKRAAAFGMKIIYSGHHPKEVAKEWNAEFVSQAELLKRSDVVAIHAAYSPALKHLLNETTLKTMKSSAFLINAARGPVVEEAALIKALEAGVIAGAALDVFEFEPKIGEDLAKLDNVVLTPHIGNATVETRAAMGKIAIANVEAVLAGKAPLHSVY
ncbi:hydroxyacid dehydrogenase [Listeria monocytogenes]|uniref:2-hydroxyacid dehydrogenase family protein n=1 Tax=Listeria monocytogenes TaxID=1639 RepID=UPI00085C254F|nr:2-hydroxyacid dehydrogenase family protein [Listeria monocytogenes]EAG9260286.1 hydroxyacid dehydrogenase [Listeria monocytogenes]EAG9491588.1 hydroxyacid dehydrogenase [Listeria monocytogenes]EIN8848998.1 2-hydroxyacid dehydrogenase family protein [Listeria monocytogenes]OEP28488.1 hydroxyacid dehydrogenase [Listeria monocytogenes]OET10993.1 hydroxyacid dehydrogenase [Listeria monocytogenes]